MLNVVVSLEKFLGFDIRGARGLHIPMGTGLAQFQFSNKVVYYYIILGMLVVVTAVTLMIMKSKVGYYFVAIREDEDAAGSIGVQPVKYKLYAACISAFLTSLGGSYLAQFQLYVDPFQFFGSSVSMEIALAAIIGGRGLLAGPIIGGIMLKSASELARTYLGGSLAGAHMVLYGAILMVTVIFLPKGITGPILAFAGKVLRSFKKARPAEQQDMGSRR